MIFERTPAAGGDTALFLASSLGPAPALRRFLPATTVLGVAVPPSQTRPDWNWATGNVVVNVAASNAAPVEALTAPGDGSSAKFVPNGRGYLYPTWTRDGSQLIVYNNSAAAQPQPCTSLINLEGVVQQANINGKDANGTAVFGGFASPSPGDPTRIVFAGQPNLTGWGPASTPPPATPADAYNQDFNYVFINRNVGGVFSSAPMESGASVSTYSPAFQGRAPQWSPNGRYVVFESDRAGGYALFLLDTQSTKAPVQLTDAAYQAQHAKFFPSGDRLIFTALQQPGKVGPRGIAWINIASLL